MIIFYFKLLFFYLFTLSCFADTLLIVASARNFGQLNQVAEEAAQFMISSKMAKQYRKVYAWKETDENNGLLLLQQIVDERVADEKLDIYSLQHGPDFSFIPKLFANEVESIIPHGFIHSLFSTGCKQWGEGHFENDEFIVEWKSEFSDHLQRLGVSEYIIYINSTNAWYMTSRLLPQALVKRNWIKSSLETLEIIDTESYRHNQVINDESSFYQVLLSIIYYPNFDARPVLGGVNSLLDPLKLNEKSVYVENYSNNYTEYVFQHKF